MPDINSEYSDSEDEDRPNRRNLPDWAKSPDIAEALRQQSAINPDDIFGRIGPLRMEEIFRTRQSRFRARTSSANWAGTDERGEKWKPTWEPEGNCTKEFVEEWEEIRCTFF